MSNNGKLPFPGYVVNVATGQLQTPQNFVAGNPGTGWRLPFPQELNGLTQQCPSAEVMRGFPAYPGMVCFLQGIASPGDGSGGMFYWSNGTYSDDDLDTIVPTVRPWPFGAGSEGAWLRANFPGGGGGSVHITATTPIVVTPSPITGTGVVSHADSGVVADTYGDATHVAQITVNEFGHVTGVTDVPISGGGGSCAIDVNAQTGTTYTVLTGDECKIVTFTNAADVTVTLPNPGTGGNFLIGWHAYFKNIGFSVVQISCPSATIDGQGLIYLSNNQELHLISDGTNYLLIRGATGGNAINSAVVAGFGNKVDGSATFGAILGGRANLITDNGQQQVIVGGRDNIAQSDESDNSAIVGGNTNLVQGANSAVLGGNNNQANTDSAVAGGDHNGAGGNCFIGGGANNSLTYGWSGAAGGIWASDGIRYGLNVLGGGSRDSVTAGQHQIVRTVLRATTASTSPTRLTWDAQTASPQTTCAPPDNTTVALNMTLVGRQGTTDQVTLSCQGALFVRNANAASAVIIGSPSFSVTSATAGAVGTTATLTADTSRGSPDISVTAPNGSAWVWTLLYEAVEAS